MSRPTNTISSSEHQSVWKQAESQLAPERGSARASQWAFRIAASLVAAGAIGLRLWGIDFGLPNLYHPDEWRIVARALSFGTGNFHPGSFELGTLGMYACFLLYGAYAVIGLSVGQFSSVHDFAVSYFVDPTPFYLIARGLFFVCGLLSIYLVFLIGKRLAGRWAGLSAAALMAVFPVHVFRSHLAFPDTMMLCFMAGALYVMIRDREPTASYKKDTIVGLLIGLGVAAKYTAVFMIGGYIVWRIWEGWVQGVGWLGIIKRLAVGGVACTLGLFIGMPYFFLDLRHALPAILGFESSSAIVGLGTESGLQEVVETMLNSDNIGIVALVCGTLGLMAAFRRWPAYTAGLMSIAGANILWALRRERLMVRWLFAAELVLCIGVGYLLVWLYSQLCAKTSATMATLGTSIVVISMLWMPLEYTIQENRAITGTDTRTMAKEWIETNLPSATKVLIVGTRAWNPQLRADKKSISRWISSAEHDPTTRYGPIVKYYKYQLEALSRASGPKYRIWKLKHYSRSAPEYEYQVPLAIFLEDGVGYVVTNGRDENEYRLERTAAAQQFYSALADSCTVVAVFGPNSRTHGPHVTIWRTPVVARAKEGKEHPGKSASALSTLEEVDRT